MASNYDPNKYDPNMIISAADDKLSGNDLEGGQMVFQSALLSWVDDAREGAAGDAEQLKPSSSSRRRKRTNKLSLVPLREVWVASGWTMRGSRKTAAN
jgi:hypothetical protein